MDGTLETRELRAQLTSIQSLQPTGDDAEAIDRIRLFEELKSAVAAAQAAQAAVFAASQRAQAAASGVKPELQDRGVAAQVGLARRVSPWQAKRYVGWCAILTRELPCTFAELQAGRVSEWRAMLVARETIFLSREDRAVVDAELAPRLEGLSDCRVEAETKKLAYRLDPHGYLDRTRGAVSDRRVSVRPAPDTMCRLTALLPVEQGVAAYAALSRHADTTVAIGDERGQGQIMADTLVKRLTGQATADAVPVEIELVMTDHTLLDSGDEPAELLGHGPIPAGLARELALVGDQPRWLRRLFTRPGDGQLAAMETRAREFTTNQRRFIRLRDEGRCRTPWCNAPIRHTDHITPHAGGGPTTTGNAAGKCEACNHTKQATGWRETRTPDGSILTRTPTGHDYSSRPPAPPGPPDIQIRTSTRIIDLVYHHEAA